MKDTERGPRCPNHVVLLVDCRDGVGICPISTCRFTYDEDNYEKTKKVQMTVNGDMIEVGDWAVEGEE